MFAASSVLRCTMAFAIEAAVQPGCTSPAPPRNGLSPMQARPPTCLQRALGAELGQAVAAMEAAQQRDHEDTTAQLQAKAERRRVEELAESTAVKVGGGRVRAGGAGAQLHVK